MADIFDSLKRSVEQQESFYARIQEKDNEMRESLQREHEQRTTSWVIDVLENQIKTFYAANKLNKALALLLPAYGQITDASLLTDGSEILIIKGFINKQQATIIQNISQVNLCLVEVDTEEPSPKRLTIGFMQS